MKRNLSLSALGIAALGTTLWAQQSTEPGPAQPPAAASSSADARYRTEADSQDSPDKPAIASTSAEPALPQFNDTSGQQPARASARAASPNSRSSGLGRSYSGEAGATVATQYPSGYATPPGGYTTAPGYAPAYAPAYISGMVGPQYNPGGMIAGSYGYQNVGQPALGNGFPPTREDAQSAREFRETVDALRKAKTDEEKAEVREKLNTLVAKQLDQDLADREKRLIEIEAKAKELREQLQQRKATKTEIQKMLVMLIENPQGGLGLPPSWMNAINQPVHNYPLPTTAPYPTTLPVINDN